MSQAASNDTLYPLVNVIKTRMINFFARMVNGKHTKLSYIMYKLLRKKQNFNFSDAWTKFIQGELSGMGMNDPWTNEGNGCSNENIKKNEKLRIRDIYNQQWTNDIRTHDYCDFYKIVKNKWGIENYLTNLSYTSRKVICKWLCRSNYLPISSSRFVIDDSIICPLCRTDSLEDETHYIYNCSFFESERQKLKDDLSLKTLGTNVVDILKSDDDFKFTNLLNFSNLL